eukprot:200023-Hanusia_phi.AAC.3
MFARPRLIVRTIGEAEVLKDRTRLGVGTARPNRERLNGPAGRQPGRAPGAESAARTWNQRTSEEPLAERDSQRGAAATILRGSTWQPWQPANRGRLNRPAWWHWQQLEAAAAALSAGLA